MTVLRVHQWADLAIFDLAHRLPTIAISDQMIRARMLAERLPDWLNANERKLDGWSEKSILVAGAGACGMTAAFVLARLGLPVVVIDEGKYLLEPTVKDDDPVAPFGQQARCRSRWIDPTQYDWPMDHWHRGRFPWNDWDEPVAATDPEGETLNAPEHHGFPFEWSAGYASQIVREQWIPRLLAGIETMHGGRIKFRWRTALLDPSSYLEFPENPTEGGVRRDGGIRVTLRNLAKAVALPEDFRALIIACGFGGERVVVPNSPEFAGFPFWGTDWFERPAFGLPHGKVDQGIVLISGGGDGALQDFLRVLTGKSSAEAIFSFLRLDENEVELDAIHSADRRVERARNWSLGPQFFGRYVGELDTVHEKAVANLLERHPEMIEMIEKLTKDRPNKTILITSEPYLTATYALNRFLARLLLAALKKTSTVEHLSRWEVASISPKSADAHPKSRKADSESSDYLDDPPPWGKPWDCCGYPWTLDLRRPSWYSTSRKSEEKQADRISADSIIVRHGVLGSEIHERTEHPLLSIPRPVPPTHLHPDRTGQVG